MLGTRRNSGQQEVQDASGGDEHAHDRTWETRVKPTGNPTDQIQGGRTTKNRADVLESGKEDHVNAKVLLGPCRNSGQQEVQDASGDDEHAHERTWESESDLRETPNRSETRESSEQEPC